MAVSLVLMAAVGTALLVLIAASLMVTSPVKLGAVGVTAWFVVLLAGLCSSLTVLLYLCKSYLQLHGNPPARLRYSLRQAILLSFSAVAALALNSLGQFGWRDGVLILLFAVLVELYVRLRWP